MAASIATPGRTRTSTCGCCCSSRSAGFGKGVGEILWGAANVLQDKLTRAQYLDEVTWTTKSCLGLQKQRISVVLHTAIAEQIVNELASGEGGRVHGAKCLAVLAGVA